MGKVARLVLASALLALTAACSNGGESSRQEPRSIATTQIQIPLASRITDNGNLLDPAQEERLSAKLRGLEQRTGHQLVVATVASLDGMDVAAYTNRLANSWGIGRRGIDDGVVLLVAPNEKKVRIEVGNGLEQMLTNSASAQVITEQMLPRFRKGDMPGGIEAAVDALVTRLDKPRQSPAA